MTTQPELFGSDEVDPTAIKIDFGYDPGHRTSWIEGVTNEGRHAFSCPIISHIHGNLYMGGYGEHVVLPEDIKHVISLYPWGQYKTNHLLETNARFRMLDNNDSIDRIRVNAIGKLAADCIKRGPTLIHCQAGLNRSGLISTLALMGNGWTAGDAIRLLRGKRSSAVLCNKTFEHYLLSL